MPDGSDIALARPLEGRTVLVTRTREQAAGLAGPLEALGAEVLYFPVIEVVDPVDTRPLDDAISRLAEYDWLVITSTNGVDRFFGRESLKRLPADVFDSVKIAAVGSATAKRLAETCHPADFVPADFRAEGLIAEFPSMGLVDGSRVLIARAEEAREILPQALTAMGAIVDVVVSYRVIPAAPVADVASRLAAGTIDVATFASGGTFRQFLAALTQAGLDAEKLTSSMELASIGPVTSDAIHAAGFEVAIEAPESTMESLARAVARRFAPDDGAPGGYSAVKGL